jgi:outer membrane protein TolC
MIEVAHAQVHEAEASRIPDWSVGFSYARRAAQYSDMMSLQFSLTLPVFAASRQNPVIDARRQELRRLESERTEMLRDHTQALEGQLADYELLSRQLMRVRAVRLPLAQQKVDLQTSAYGVNKADLAAVLGARRELIDVRLADIELQRQRDVAAARIYFAYVESTP